jgi:glycine betaine/proline transport system permease protein
MDAVTQWITSYKIPVGPTIAAAMAGLKAGFGWGFDVIAAALNGLVEGTYSLLLLVPPPLLVLGIAAVAHLVRRSWKVTAFAALAMLFIINQGYLNDTLKTVVITLYATAMSMMIGVPLGIAAGHRGWLARVMRPVLDLMQTLPTPVYLIPMLSFFGLGVVSGIVATIIFALPAPVRMTQLGIQSVPTALREAGEAFGATRAQLLWKIELPHARPAIMEGLTQCIMLCLSMSVIAAMVSSGGLGIPVLRALNQMRPAMGYEAGIAIVLVAIVLDRILRRPETAKGR